MEVVVMQGDVFEQRGDVLICPANPQLNMSGGVNGEILRRGGGGIQRELRKFMAEAKVANVPPGTVMVTGAGPLSFKQIVHAVAIDAFYETNETVVAHTLVAAWRLAAERGLTQMVMPTIGTGYGRMSMESFARAFHIAVVECSDLSLKVTLVVRDAESMDLMSQASA